MTDCLFCKIIAGDIPSTKVYGDDSVYAFADIHPVNLGHTLVISKEHYPNLYELPDQNLEQIMRVAKKIALAQKKALGADGINIEMNNDSAAGQIIFHAHVHVIPRKNDDGYRHWKGPEEPSEAIEKAAKLLNQELSGM